MKKLLLVAALFCAQPLLAAPVELPTEVKIKPGRLARIAAKGDSKTVWWINLHEDLDAIPSETGKWLIVSGPLPGRYRLAAYGVDPAGGPSEPVYVTVIVEGPPTPPVPPTPPAPPTPPTPPTPPLPPAPIPAPGFRVLMLHQDADKMTKEQSAILTSVLVRKYLDAKCVKDADNTAGAYRIWDNEVDASEESAPWQEAKKRPRASLPWIVISNGTTGYEGPLPANVQQTLELLKKYGGA